MNVLGILTADWHISGTAPVARSAEPDWFLAQYRAINQIKMLQEQYDCLVFICGDIFDKWNPSVEAINFLLDAMPKKCYAIPGNHDLPSHVYENRHRAGYGVLIKSGRLFDVLPRFPDNWLKGSHCPGGLLLCHSYIWIDGKGYENAPEECRMSKYMPMMEGYRTVAFGDNHQGFKWSGYNREQKIDVFNCGTLLRRKRDEREYRPQVGLLMEDGSVEPYYLDVSEDKWLEDRDFTSAVLEQWDPNAFIKDLGELASDPLNFRERLLQVMNSSDMNPSVKAAILEALDG